MIEFRREKLPPAAGDPTIIGSWQNLVERIGTEEGKTYHNRVQHIEILDSYLFALIADDSGGGSWLACRYTVDTTKNPKWIDLDLVGPHGDKSKLYGTYEFADGQLKLALGTTGKRALRPLELKPDKDVHFFDVKIAKEPLGTVKLLPASTTPAKDLPSGKAIPRPERRLPSIEKSKKP